MTAWVMISPPSRPISRHRRLLIAVLFLYVGLSELHRLLFQPFTPYLPGDGHDVVWPKAVELLLAVPFILGFQVRARRPFRRLPPP